MIQLVYSGRRVPKERWTDCMRLTQVMASKGYKVTMKDCHLAWLAASGEWVPVNDYSDELIASRLLPHLDESPMAGDFF